MEKAGVDDYAAVICNADWLREQGVQIPEKVKMLTKEGVRSDSKKKK